MPPRSSPCMKPNAQLAHTYTHADGMEKRNGLGKGFTIFPFTSFVRSLGEVCGCILLSRLPILSRGFGYRVSMYLSMTNNPVCVTIWYSNLLGKVWTTPDPSTKPRGSRWKLPCRHGLSALFQACLSTIWWHIQGFCHAYAISMQS